MDQRLCIQSVINVFFHALALKLWVLLLYLDWLVQTYNVLTTIIFVYSNWANTSICRSLSYPLRSLMT